MKKSLSTYLGEDIGHGLDDGLSAVGVRLELGLDGRVGETVRKLSLEGLEF